MNHDVDGLTRIQASVLDALRKRADVGKPPPTYRELCAEFGWRSTGTARDHLRALVRKGFIKTTGTHRNIRLRDDRPPIAFVPLLGRVVAGIPVISEEDAEGHVAVPAAWAGRDALFALRVSGDSMRDAGILEGDHVIVRKTSTGNDGDIVVATFEGETTLKRLRLRRNRVSLVAENPVYPPIEVRSEDPVIQGVVVGLMRSYRVSASRARRAGHGLAGGVVSGSESA
ncbi:MAG TPA: transcriptional repressor LexA [Candidatus Binataceae bacterium]|nr:transcriptional repressor LexA [Candidatus Binataceae bacterium]